VTLFSSLYSGRLDRELGTDDSTQLFTTARRKAAINEGQEQFADLTECLQRQSTFSITGGTAEYNLHSTAVLPGGDFVRFSKEQIQYRYTDASSNLTVLAGDDLPRRDVAWLNRYEPGWQISTVASTQQQDPQAHYVRADGGNLYLGFWPTPSTGSSASADVVVPYIARPTPMTSDTSEPFTVNSSVRGDLRVYHQALVHYAAHQLEKFRRDEQASASQLQQFLGYVARYTQQARTKGGQAVGYARNYWRTRGTDRGTDPRR
jgi:hypothetical protein